MESVCVRPDRGVGPVGRVPERSAGAAGPVRGGPARGSRVLGSPDVLKIVVVRLRVIGEPTRMQIMALLDQHASTVQELTDRLPSTRPNVSKHLRVLQDAGLVGCRKDGNYNRYELADWSALWLVEQVAASVADQLDAYRETLAADQRRLL